MVKEPTDPEMVKDVVQALAAFAKMRVLHTEVLRVFRELPADAWQEIPSDMVVEAVSSYAQFQIEDLEFNRFLADLIASRSWRNLRDYQLANLAFAAATLELGPEANLYSCFEAAFSKANVNLGGLGWIQWDGGLKKMCSTFHLLGGFYSKWFKDRTHKSPQLLDLFDVIPLGSFMRVA